MGKGPCCRRQQGRRRATSAGRRGCPAQVGLSPGLAAGSRPTLPGNRVAALPRRGIKPADAPKGEGSRAACSQEQGGSPLCQEAQLLAVLLGQADQALHLLGVGAQLLAEVLDHCRRGRVKGTRGVGELGAQAAE